MDTASIQKWVRLGLLNLAIVALFGTLMRYKIAFDFPYLEQKNLLHAHSHFAFSGWISQVLYSGLVSILAPFLSLQQQKKYKVLLILNLCCAFGMLAAFTVQGYQAVSISFSTLTVFVAVAFAWFFIRDTRSWPSGHPSKPWAIAGLLLNVLASAGPFSLAYLIATKTITPNLYLGSVYYYLHFQYNGWFFFGSLALAAACLPVGLPPLKKYFRLFAFTAIPTYFLSVLWANLPAWLYVITLLATLVQLGAWVVLAIRFYPLLQSGATHPVPRWVQVFFYAAALAITIKFVLQAVSVIPALSQLVFGFRPIVIAYLHLVLLGVYSLFLIGYGLACGLILPNKRAKTGAFIFLAGVVLNESFLAIQGFAAFAYFPVPHINPMLLGAAVVLLTGAILLVVSQWRGRSA